ncbi:PREDICTED: tolloid-like protein 1 [Branchiostoma belcheri]|uniref:Tolloid-like protein 1 n=1 Tax=Branchiostoma belcheri TaxID=7741 RepID=A0A6P4ZY65_BRABE|nr:PREDICTED: tolloid-like protein 1 [Branchiostoma belcheri]
MWFVLLGVVCFAAIASGEQPQCGGNLAGHAGDVYSPNFPNEYDANLDCMWTIPARGGSVTVEFKNFTIEPPEIFLFYSRCNLDYVEIIVGDRSRGRFCGTEMPPAITAADDTHIRFVTDQLVSGPGFQFSYLVQHGLAGPCGEHLDDSYGQVTSPGYPQNYPNNQYCTWTIPHTQYPVTVKFIDFELEEGGYYSSCYDHLEIFDGRTSLGKYCGTDVPAVLTTTNDVRINFKSDSSVGQRGFKFEYRVAAPATLAPSEPTKPATDKPGCTTDYVNFTGHCYKSFTDLKTRDEARQACAADGGVLAMPKDSATNDFLASLSPVTGGRWLGLTDADGDGQWVFEDGQILTSSDYSNWQPNDQPNGSGCVGFWSTQSVWDPRGCDYLRGFICQII